MAGDAELVATAEDPIGSQLDADHDLVSEHDLALTAIDTADRGLDVRDGGGDAVRRHDEVGVRMDCRVVMRRVVPRDEHVVADATALLAGVQGVDDVGLACVGLAPDGIEHEADRLGQVVHDQVLGRLMLQGAVLGCRGCDADAGDAKGEDAGKCDELRVELHGLPFGCGQIAWCRYPGLDTEHIAANVNSNPFRILRRKYQSDMSTCDDSKREQKLNKPYAYVAQTLYTIFVNLSI